MMTHQQARMEGEQLPWRKGIGAAVWQAKQAGSDEGRHAKPASRPAAGGRGGAGLWRRQTQGKNDGRPAALHSGPAQPKASQLAAKPTPTAPETSHAHAAALGRAGRQERACVCVSGAGEGSLLFAAASGTGSAGELRGETVPSAGRWRRNPFRPLVEGTWRGVWEAVAEASQESHVRDG